MGTPSVQVAIVTQGYSILLLDFVSSRARDSSTLVGYLPLAVSQIRVGGFLPSLLELLCQVFLSLPLAIGNTRL